MTSSVDSAYLGFDDQTFELYIKENNTSATQLRVTANFAAITLAGVAQMCRSFLQRGVRQNFK
jgi:hypothetical protein